MLQSSVFAASRRVVALAASVLAAAQPAIAAAEAQIAVVARVLPHASVRMLSLPTALQVTRADVVRGYVEAPTPAQLVVQDNTGGFVLSFDTTGDLFRRVHVAGLGAPLELSASGGNVMHTTSARGAAVTTLDLAFRFDLDRSAVPGTYAFPVRISVTPL
jgi:hypothetical protein